METPKNLDPAEISIIEWMQNDFDYLASRNIDAARHAVLVLMQKLEEHWWNLPKRNERIEEADKRISLNFRWFVDSKVIDSNIIVLLNGLKFVFETTHDILDEICILRFYEDLNWTRTLPEYYFTLNHKRVKKLKWKENNEMFRLLKEEWEKIAWIFKNLNNHEITTIPENINAWFSLVKKEWSYMILFNNANYSLLSLENKKIISDLAHLIEALNAFKVII